MKYFFLAFDENTDVNPTEYVFNTEAHPFKHSHFDHEEAQQRLGF